MTPSSLSDEAIFMAALELAAGRERDEYVAAACAGHPELYARIVELLAANDDSTGLLDCVPPGMTQSSSLLANQRQRHSDTSSEPALGTRIGPYKLLQPLGEGGMGAVYMVEQEKPVRRRVALKIIKPGMDSRQVIARFEAERQALAMMDHENIARVLDAGATDAGRPYFVMELVKGVPITEYCDKNHLTPRQRLELFLPVCHAIQHAHQKGIIHRDVKPSNVLVTLYDGKAVPKIIDFGVAKAIQQRLTERTMFTEHGQIVGTLEYMSPEQAEMSGLDIDTRSDLYSLGVLLYELLTGTTPLERSRFRGAAFAEMLRVIREEEPPKPSTRLSATEGIASIAAQRRTEPKQLNQLVRGDLDLIVMKTLEKDRTRRYETASGLARDIERYLHNEPIEARPPSAGYRLKKLAGKHKRLFATAAAFAALLLIGAVVSTWQAVRATRAETVARGERDDAQRAREAEAAARSQAERSRDAEVQSRQASEKERLRAVTEEQRANAERDRAVAAEARAEAEAAKARDEAAMNKAVNDFLMQDLLAQASPYEQPDRDLKLRTVLDRAAARIEGRFQGMPTVEAALRTTLGQTFGSLGEYSAAASQFERAVKTRREELGEEHADTLETMSALATVYISLGRYAEAESLARQASTAGLAQFGEDDLKTHKYEGTLALALFYQGKHAQAETIWVKALEASRRELGPEHTRTLSLMNNLAGAYIAQKKICRGGAVAP